ncbi:MAG: hypothetical protein KAX27_05980 [Candidatus Aminicenantes bacterium]|nr:hypothetical protein [Candidatus Aminicenantes bacterium]
MGYEEQELKGGKMEEKYNPGMIHLHAGTYIAPMIFETQTFVMDDEFYSKVVIFIEIMGSEEEGYEPLPIVWNLGFVILNSKII